ncbi:hypothetical protein L596_025814 [Steinernema carpocapsae]|uniref:G-protein coupled receptors family 1 profile domain-containing protein n=1 Tax=Steinernema carpocapsae TaxID=34508 RepID=A0A4U5M8X7_STECR|nr:hypothetical protein L596_025814 [Steinernema carpocapsae]
MTPMCGPHGDPLIGHEEVSHTNGLYIGIFYIFLFIIMGVPQAMCLYAICHKKHLQYSCYKLMLMVSVLDMFNLTEGSLVCGLLSIFNLSHCNSPIVLIFGKMIMGKPTLGILDSVTIKLQTLVSWMIYCFTSIILALNRVLEFVSRPLSWAYGLTMALTVPRPFYYYVPAKGQLSFLQINEAGTELEENKNHIVNNSVKGLSIAVAYVIMLIAIRVKLKNSGMALSKMEVRLSIQAFFVGLMSVSSIVYCLFGYLPIGNFSLIGPVGMVCWLSTHGVSGYIYLIMNKSLRETSFGLFCKKSKLLKSKQMVLFTTSVNTVERLSSRGFCRIK